MKVTIVPIVIDTFGTVTKGLLGAWRTWKLADERRLSKWQHNWKRPEYWGESWRLEETRCHSSSIEKPLGNIDNFKGVNNNNNNNNNNKGDTNCGWCTWNDPQRIGKEPGRFENIRTRRDHPDYSIIMISQNTEESPGYLRRLSVSQTSVRNHQLTQQWKTLKGVK